MSDLTETQVVNRVMGEFSNCASAAHKADRGAAISGATNSPSPVIDPVPRCAGPPVYPQAFLEWLKTSESPARKALRGLVPF